MYNWHCRWHWGLRLSMRWWTFAIDPVHSRQVMNGKGIVYIWEHINTKFGSKQTVLHLIGWKESLKWCTTDDSNHCSLMLSLCCILLYTNDLNTMQHCQLYTSCMRQSVTSVVGQRRQCVKMLLLLWVFAVCVCCSCRLLTPRFTAAVPVTACLLFIFVMATLLRTALTDPGIIPRATPQEAADTERHIGNAGCCLVQQSVIVSNDPIQTHTATTWQHIFLWGHVCPWCRM